MGFLDRSPCSCRGRGKSEQVLEVTPLHRAASAGKARTRSGIVSPVFHCSFPIADFLLSPLPSLCYPHSRHPFLQETHPTATTTTKGSPLPHPHAVPSSLERKQEKPPPGLIKPRLYATGKTSTHAPKKPHAPKQSTKPSAEG